MVCQKPLTLVSPGVSLARPVTDVAGNVLLPQGTVIDDCLLHLLKLWAVKSVCVQKEKINIPSPAPTLEGRFQHNLLQDMQHIETAIVSEKYVAMEKLVSQLRHAVAQLSSQPGLGLSLAAQQRLDDYTYWHSLSTALISMGIAIKLGWSEEATVE